MLCRRLYRLHERLDQIFRWQVLVLSLGAQMRRMVTPHRVTLVSYGGKPIPDEVAQSVVNFVVVYVITFVVFPWRWPG